MQLPLQCNTESSLSLQDQLFNQIRQLIVDGRLKPGTRLPASRTLASDLDLSRNTVVLTYERLVAEGYLESQQPVGTFVASGFVHDDNHPPPVPGQEPGEAADAVPQAPPVRRAPLHFSGKLHTVVSPYRQPVPYDFWVGWPDARLFPIKEWMTHMRRKLRDMQEGNARYVDPAGLITLREAIADYVGVARAIRAEPDQIIVVNGTQEALTLLSQLFIRPGTTVATEDPCYQGAVNVFSSHGACICPVPLDADGLVIDQLPAQASLVYLTPAHQYPTGVMLSADRREQLLQWCHATGAYALEDDYDSDFCYDSAPLPALKSQDKADKVIYMGTFSKSLGGGLRAGYMIMPPHLVEVARAAKGLLNNCSGWAVQALLAEFLVSGEYQNHLRRIRTLYRARRNCLVDLLECHVQDSRVLGTHGGMHVAWKLPSDWPVAVDLETRARQAGVGVYAMETANASLIDTRAASRYERTLFLGYASLNEAEIAEGVQRLFRAMDPSGFNVMDLEDTAHPPTLNDTKQ